MPFLALLHKYDNSIVDFKNLEDQVSQGQKI